MFISMVIHDFRNPINAIVFMIDSISSELEEEFERVNEIKKMYKGRELEAFSLIQKGI